MTSNLLSFVPVFLCFVAILDFCHWRFLKKTKNAVMVTIINGEIVADSDPRAQEYRNRGRRQERQQGQSQQQQWTYGTHDQQNPNGLEGGLFTQLNNRLLTAGFPRWNLGQYVVEPIMSVSLILALVLFGLRGVLLVGVVWFLMQQGRHIWTSGSCGRKENNDLCCFKTYSSKRFAWILCEYFGTEKNNTWNSCTSENTLWLALIGATVVLLRYIRCLSSRWELSLS